MRYIAISLALVIVSCQTTVEDDHAHDAQGGHIIATGPIPTVTATVWTDKTELFVEFPALIVGTTSRFAAHFTILDKHQPVREGKVTVSLIKGEKGIRHSVEAPTSPGIYAPSLLPKEGGIYQLKFDIETPSLSDQIVLNNIKVFDTLEAAEKELGVIEDGAAITFLKEQAWKIEFQTAPVVLGEIFNVISTYGVWKVAPSDYKTLVATSAGTITFNKNLTEGSKVKKGQALLNVSSEGLTSNNLSTEIKKALVDFEQAELEYKRKKQLYEADIVSKAEFEKVEQKYKVAKYNYESLNSGYSAGGKKVIAPIDGYVKAISVGNGTFVNQGSALLTITSHKSTLLETQVSSSYASQLKGIHDVWYQPKSGYWSSLVQTKGHVISVGKEVHDENPLLSVISQVNEFVEMPEGSFTEIQLTYGEPINTLLIPESALMEDYGNFSVMVQVGGESFERRQVVIGRRNGDIAEIQEGLSLGETVVTKGAYQVKMASMSGVAPAHGHEH
jgi:cobalt-zinc-cadmium efflux system membrane fusion protein